jgi:hypothetical protein
MAFLSRVGEMVEKKMPKIRIYRIDPATFISDRKAILEELVIEAGLTDEEVNELFRELHAEPWCEDVGVLDAVIDKVAARLGIVIEYEFPQ